MLEMRFLGAKASDSLVRTHDAPKVEGSILQRRRSLQSETEVDNTPRCELSTQGCK